MSKPLVSQELIKQFRSGKFVSCSNFHYGSCEYKFLHRMLTSAKSFALFYGPAHVLPVFLFKMKQLRKTPVPILTHMFQNIIRSVVFGSSLIGLSQYGICVFNKLFRKTTRLNWILITFISALPIFIEAKSRRQELTLYLIPRLLDTIWNLLKKYGFPIRIKYFEIIIFGVALGLLAYFLNNDEEYIKPTYRSTLRHIFGNN